MKTLNLLKELGIYFWKEKKSQRFELLTRNRQSENIPNLSI